MTMQANTLSKHGILIGAAAIAIFFVTSCSNVMALKGIHETVQQKDQHSSYILKMGGLLASYLLGIAVSALFIAGVVKRRESFMAPWVISALLLALSGCVYAIYDIITNGSDNMNYIFYDTGGICVACIVLYPVYMLYQEVRSGNRQRRQQLELLNVVPQIGTGSNVN